MIEKTIFLATFLSLGTGAAVASDTVTEVQRSDLGNRASVRLEVSQNSFIQASDVLVRVSFINKTSRNMAVGSEEPWEILYLLITNANGDRVNRSVATCVIPSKRKYLDFFVRANTTAVLESNVNNGFLKLSCFGFAPLPVGKYTISARLLTSVRILDPAVGYFGGESTISRTAIRSAPVTFEVVP